MTNISRRIALADPSVHALSHDETRHLTTLFTILPGNLADDLLPKIFVHLSEHALVLDLLLAGDFLRHLIFLPSLAYSRGIGKAAGLGDPAGERLEEETIGYFSRKLGIRKASMVINRKLGTREIDIAFVLNGLLVVIDCKAKMKDWDYMEGHHRKIRNRLTEFRTELNVKLPQRIEMIRAGRCKDVLDPSSFSAALGLVCTSSVEFLPKSEREFWSRDLPLVGPPEELLDTIKNLVRGPPSVAAISATILGQAGVYTS